MRKLTLTLIAALFTVALSFGQTIYPTNSSTNVSCDGWAFVDSTALDSAVGWLWYDTSGTTIQNGGYYVFNLCPGTYYIDVVDSSGLYTLNFDILADSTVISCAGFYAAASPWISADSGVCNGQALAYGVGGSGSYSHIWSNGDTTVLASNLCGNTSYYVTITDDVSGCVVSDSVFVMDSVVAGPCDNFSVNAWTTSDADTGMCNGSVTANVSGAMAAYTLWWTPIGSSSTTISNACGGQHYSVAAYDSLNGCYAFDSTYVDIIPDTTGDPCVGFSANPYVTADADSGMCNGSASAINVSGGTGLYSYYWSHNGANSMNVTGLCANQTYTVTVTDILSGCIDSSSVFVNEIVDTTVISCDGFYAIAFSRRSADSGVCNGQIWSYGIGGSGSYSFNWSHGDTVQFPSGLCGGGTVYNLTVTDLVTGCVAYDSAIILDSVVTGPCAGFNAYPVYAQRPYSGLCNGKALTQTWGGSGSTTTTWSAASSGGAITPWNMICASTVYVATVTDTVTGCVATTQIFMYDSIPPDPCLSFAVSASTTMDSDFGMCNGTVTAMVTGATASYTLSWTPGGSSATSITNACDGQYYSVSAYDSINGCYSFDSTYVDVIPDPCASFYTNAWLSQKSDSGMCNGWGSLYAGGGSGSYSYSWSTGDSTQHASGLCGGMAYLGTVTDNVTGCVAMDTLFMLDSVAANPCDNFYVYATTTADADSGMCNGSVTANVSGATGPYAIWWTPGGSVSSTITNACGGQYYTVEVYDSINNCYAFDSTYVGEIIDTTNPNPCVGFYASTWLGQKSVVGMCNGFGSVYAIGGSGSYSYSWSNGDLIQHTTLSLCGNTAYVGTVTDLVTGCVATDTLFMEDSTDICATFYTNAYKLQAAYDGYCNGMAYAYANGSGSYTTTWSSGGMQVEGDSLCGNTTYTVTVFDNSTGCTATSSIFINDSIGSNPCANFSVNAYALTDADSGMCNGSATVNVSGGSGSYYYNWSPAGGYTATATGLCGNQTYTVTVYDSINNCTATSDAYVYEVIDSSNVWNNLYADVWVTDATNSLICDGTADVSVYGGVAPFSFAFSPTVTSSGAMASNLCPGIYDVTVTDAFNHTYTTTFMVASMDSVINNNDSTYVDSTIIDTTNYNDPVVDCDIDFNDVVSVLITGYDFTDSTGIDSTTFDSITYFTVEWTMTFGNGNTVTYIEYYQFNDYGIYWCILNIFCDEKSGFYNHLKVTDFIDIRQKSTGISGSNQITDVDIYPNPASDHLNIDLEGNFNYQLFNMEGQLIQSGSDNNRTVLEVGNLPAGMYMVRLMDADLRSTVKKFMVE